MTTIGLWQQSRVFGDITSINHLAHLLSIFDSSSVTTSSRNTRVANITGTHMNRLFRVVNRRWLRRILGIHGYWVLSRLSTEIHLSSVISGSTMVMTMMVVTGTMT